MSTQSITHHPLPGSGLGEILESVTPNFAVLFVLALLGFIWFKLSPIWLPPVSWLISFLAPVFWFLCGIFVVVAGALLGAFLLAVAALVLGGTIPSLR